MTSETKAHQLSTPSRRVRLQEIVIDCAAPDLLAAFWAQILDANWARIHDTGAVVDADPLLLNFQQVPEPKPGPKNRLHLDVEVPDAAVAVAQALSLGATQLREELTEGDGYVVMQDPEANEFCFVIDNRGAWRGGIRAALDAAGGSRQP